MKTDTNNTLYPIQVWLTTTLGIAPLILLLGGLVNTKWNVELVTIPLFMLVIPLGGLLLSSPVLLIGLLVFRVLIREVSSETLIKLLFAVISITGVAITFWIISGSMAVMLGLIYSASVIVASLFYRINKK
jgi:hypothetical protein